MSERIDNALRELRAEYWQDIRDYASEIVAECSGREAIDERIWETCDGSAWVIYTQSAQIVLLVSDNHDAWEDYQEDRPEWSVMAFHAMRDDLAEQVEAIRDDDDDDDDECQWREEYRNGDAITLVANGCDSCRPAMIQGVLCHESGCADAWRDEVRECQWCGCEFNPVDRDQAFCDESCGEVYAS